MRKKLGKSSKKRIDYYPFGMPMPNRNVEGDYRYKFQGQEKDPETGKEAFELRLWDSRIGRWLTTDPAREFASPYLGMGNNPIGKIDPDGGSTEDIIYLDSNGNEIDRIAMAGPDIYLQETFGSIQNGTNAGSFEVVTKFEKNVITPPNHWISQFTQPRPRVACKRTCDLIAGNAPLSKAIQVSLEKGSSLNPTSDFNKGLQEIDNYLSNNKAITVGVHHKFGTTYNSDKTTDHFVIIIGKGLDKGQLYYRFYEVATRHASMGTHAQNRLYINAQSVSGNTQYRNSAGIQRHYSLTQVRPR